MKESVLAKFGGRNTDAIFFTALAGVYIGQSTDLHGCACMFFLCDVTYYSRNSMQTLSQRSYKTKWVLLWTPVTAGRLPLVPSGTQCKEKRCCYYRIFYNDISFLSSGICQGLFIKPRCNIRFLQDASVKHKVSKGGPSWGKSWLLLNEGRWRGKGERKKSLGEFNFLTSFSSKISSF